MGLVVKKRSMVRLFAMICAIVGVVVVATIFIVRQQRVDAATGGMTFTAVATHPQANVQPTAWGRTIDDLMVDGTTLYAGYGDYDVNTGPIHINPFDLTSNTFTGSVLSVPTEQVMVLRKFNGSIYAPMTDPRAGWTSNVGFATNQGGTWVNRNNTPAIHVFDVATLDGSDLWMVGSSVESDGTTRRGATAHRSTDGGATWSVVQTDATLDYEPPSTARDFNRYYWIAELNGKIYMQAQNVVPAAPVRIFDGTTWTSGTTDSVCGVADPGLVEVFNGYIICGLGGSIRLFDGTTVTLRSVYDTVGSVRDFYVADDGYMYVLGTTGIARSDDGQEWTQLAVSPSNASSIAVYNDRIYLGTSDSRIMVSDTTITNAPPLQFGPPTVTTMSPRRILNSTGGTLTIYGADFRSPTVTVGGVEVSIISTSGSYISVTVPPRDDLGMADVVITNSDGQSVTVPDGVEFYEIEKPVIESIEVKVQGDGTKHLIIHGKNLISVPSFGYADGLYASLISLNGVDLPFCTAGTSFTSNDLEDMGYSSQYFSDEPPCYQLFAYDGTTGLEQLFSLERAVIILPEDFNVEAGSIVITSPMRGSSNIFSFGQSREGDSSVTPSAPSTGVGSNLWMTGVVVFVVVLIGTGMSILAHKRM